MRKISRNFAAMPDGLFEKYRQIEWYFTQQSFSRNNFQMNVKFSLFHLGSSSIWFYAKSAKYLPQSRASLLFFKKIQSFSRKKDWRNEIVPGRVPENPRTRTFEMKPDKPEPELCWNIQTRSNPNPNFKPAGTRSTNFARKIRKISIQRAEKPKLFC